MAANNAEQAAWNAAQHTKNGMMRALLDNAMVAPNSVAPQGISSLGQYATQPVAQAPRKFGAYYPHTNVMDNLYSKRTMTIQVTPIENGYVVAIGEGMDSIPRLLYAKDLNDVGQQITAFGVTQELEGKGANT